ncbi:MULTISPECIES: dTMP kinase [unclassified Lysinibacillus]|uniref:dTMP kinase n=1 Tax=unclassified Lysinibacillus TaxID=2636778 RepID=UPI00380709CB
MNNLSRLIYVFGIDGSGKTTLVKNLETYLSKKQDVISVPSSKISIFTNELEVVASKMSQTRRQCFSPLIRGTAWGLDLLYKANEIIEPNLTEGKTVILDRYNICNLVFSQLNGVDISLLKKVHASLVKPDIYLYLKIDTKIAWERILKRGEPLTPKEYPDQLSKAVELYEYYILKEKIPVNFINANLSEEEILAQAIEILEKDLSVISS